jgi:uncharacterized peroxidase-related enzyme
MSRIAIPEAGATHADTQATLEGVGKTLGFIPKLHRLLAVNPHVFAGWAGLQGNLAKTLDVKTRDAIALAASDTNNCEYCLGAHTYVSATFAKLSPEEIALNRIGQSSDPKRAVAAKFAKAILASSGRVSDEELAAVRAAGYSDSDITAIIALTAQFSMTNFLNNVAQTEPDFPAVETIGAA